MRFVVATCLLFLSCSKETPAPAPAPTLAPTPPLPLFERLALEAQRRDQADPSTTKVLAALTAAGLALGEPRQQSAMATNASTCLMLDAPEHVTLSICEYADAASALAGAEQSRAVLKQVNGHTVDVKRSTTLSVIDSQADPASGSVRTRARAAFQSL